MSIYTRDGDNGYTTNLQGNEISKASSYMELQGNIDEANANIGHLRSLLSFTSANGIDVDDDLKRIQLSLFLIGSELSMDFSNRYVTNNDSKWLEERIDSIDEIIEELDKFIYQSGTPAATYAHVTRCVVRRTEREFVRFLEDRTYPECYKFINRLSDYLFALARFINKISNAEEEKFMI